MKVEKNQKGLIIALGLVIVLFIVLIIVGEVESKGGYVKIEKDDSITTMVDNVRNYYMEDYSSNGSTATNKETKVSDSTKSSGTNSDYILEKSATTELTDDDLKGLSAQQLTYARNEIYARYGRPFQSSELKQYFQNKSWYKENASYTDSMVTPLEEANAQKIADYQSKNNLEYNP